MPKFILRACRDVTEKAFIEIEAATQKEAKNIFYEKYMNGDYDNEFQVDDEQINVSFVEDEL